MSNWLPLLITLACAIGYFIEVKNGYSEPDGYHYKWVGGLTGSFDGRFWLPVIGWVATLFVLLGMNIPVFFAIVIDFVIWWVYCVVLALVTGH